MSRQLSEAEWLEITNSLVVALREVSRRWYEALDKIREQERVIEALRRKDPQAYRFQDIRSQGR